MGHNIKPYNFALGNPKRNFVNRVGKFTSNRICWMPQEDAHSQQRSSKVVLKLKSIPNSIRIPIALVGLR